MNVERIRHTMNTTCLHKSKYWDTCFDEVSNVVILFQIIIQSFVLLFFIYTIFKFVYGSIRHEVLWRIERMKYRRKLKKQMKLEKVGTVDELSNFKVIKDGA